MTTAANGASDAPASTPAKEAYEVYGYSVPKLTPDGKGNLPCSAPKVQTFPALEAARKAAADLKSAYDRVVLIHRTEKDGKAEHKLVERYRGGGDVETAEQIVRR